MGKPEHTKYLLANALRKLLKEKEYKDITVADIVRECGVSRYTFYYHFKDKQDLVNWIYLDTRSRAITVTSVDTVYDNCQRLISLMKEDAQLYNQVRHDIDQNGFKDYYNQLNYHCYLNVFKSHLGEKKLSPEIRDCMGRFFSYAGSELFLDAMEGKLQVPLDQVVDIMDVIWKRGMYGALDYFAEQQPDP